MLMVEFGFRDSSVHRFLFVNVDVAVRISRTTKEKYFTTLKQSWSQRATLTCARKSVGDQLLLTRSLKRIKQVPKTIRSLVCDSFQSELKENMEKFDLKVLSEFFSQGVWCLPIR